MVVIVMKVLIVLTFCFSIVVPSSMVSAAPLYQSGCTLYEADNVVHVSVDMNISGWYLENYSTSDILVKFYNLPGGLVGGGAFLGSVQLDGFMFSNLVVGSFPSMQSFEFSSSTAGPNEFDVCITGPSPMPTATPTGTNNSTALGYVVGLAFALFVLLFIFILGLVIVSAVR